MPRYVGMDLGTTYTRIWKPGEGVILRSEHHSEGNALLIGIDLISRVYIEKLNGFYHLDRKSVV